MSPLPPPIPPPIRPRVHERAWLPRLLTGGKPRPLRAELRKKRLAATGHPRVGWFRTIAGWILLVVGLLGIVLPMLPAIVLIPAGVALVGRNSFVIRFTRTRTKLLLRRAETWPGWRGRLGRWLAVKERHFARRLRERRRRHAASRAPVNGSSDRR